jgi:hypothetical protein
MSEQQRRRVKICDANHQLVSEELLTFTDLLDYVVVKGPLVISKHTGEAIMIRPLKPETCWKAHAASGERCVLPEEHERISPHAASSGLTWKS